MKKKLPLTLFEIIAYSVLGLLGIWGLVYIALGVSCEFVRYDSDLAVANSSLKSSTAGMGFLAQGFLIAGIALVVAVVILLIHAKNSDRDYEKQQRRAARLAKGNSQVIDVEAEEKPAE